MAQVLKQVAPEQGQDGHHGGRQEGEHHKPGQFGLRVVEEEGEPDGDDAAGDEHEGKQSYRPVHEDRGHGLGTSPRGVLGGVIRPRDIPAAGAGHEGIEELPHEEDAKHSATGQDQPLHLENTPPANDAGEQAEKRAGQARGQPERFVQRNPQRRAQRAARHSAEQVEEDADTQGEAKQLETPLRPPVHDETAASASA